MTSLISHKIRSREQPKDVFYTPKTAVEQHLSLITEYIKPTDKWLDPFFGEGAYYNSFPTENKDFTEIALQKDFFKYTIDADVICSNPPYSMINEVLEHSIKLNPRVISYLIGMGNLTPRRIEYMNNNGYGLAKLCMTKIYKWYGMSFITVFVKGAKNCMTFDRKIHK